MSSTSSGGSGAIKRACDACHRRKVKCINDGSKICKNCNQAGLKCTYNAVPQKKGPKGSRAKVISELREIQRQYEANRQPSYFGSPPGSPLFTRVSNALPPELIDICTEFFFRNVYPTQPILHRETLAQCRANMHRSPEDYCLIISLCAYMMIQPNIVLPPGLDLGLSVDVTSNDVLGSKLLADALEARKACSYFENPTMSSVITSFFFFGCYFCLEKHNTAWFHLREATTLALLAEMHQEETYSQLQPEAATLRRRLFWLLFVTERAYALQTQKPLTLHDTIELPSITEEPESATELTGFNHLISLFRPFDDTFVGVWNQSTQGCNAQWIQELQQQLSDALPKYLRSTETQAVDLRTSQQWLRTMIWQMSISQRLLSSTASSEAMTFRFPVELSREFLTEASQFSQQAMEVHGIGLVKKLFDVTCTLIDVMTCVPMDQNGFEVGPREYLNHLLHMISKLRGGQQRYLPLLLTKANDALPRMGQSAIVLGPPSIDTYFEEDSTERQDSSTSGPGSVNGPMSALGSDYESGPELEQHSPEYADMMGTPTYALMEQPTPFDSSTPAARYSPHNHISTE